MKLSQIILIFHNGGEKMLKIFNQGKTNELFFFNERKRAEIRSRKCCYRNMMNTIVYRINKCFWKESYATVWYSFNLYFPLAEISWQRCIQIIQYNIYQRFSYSDNLVSEKKYIYTCEEKRKGKEKKVLLSR